MITCPICKVGLLNPTETGFVCNSCQKAWEFTKHNDFVNVDNREEINELYKPLKNNVTGNIKLRKISNRTIVLLYIHNWQKKTGEGIMFNELVEILKKERGMSRSLVSKCQDSLWDIHLIDDKMRLKDGFWAKVIFIEPDVIPFVENIAKDLEGDMKI